MASMGFKVEKKIILNDCMEKYINLFCRGMADYIETKVLNFEPAFFTFRNNYVFRKLKKVYQTDKSTSKILHKRVHLAMFVT